jgi:hypothetical protein
MGHSRCRSYAVELTPHCCCHVHVTAQLLTSHMLDRDMPTRLLLSITLKRLTA